MHWRTLTRASALAAAGLALPLLSAVPVAAQATTPSGPARPGAVEVRGRAGAAEVGPTLTLEEA
ncbi:MAG TPA: hypothetical protein VFQ38_14625, partial [Longimicrobiales bacterium]|nr:hypothetical protein [Longimicrobiales bacterium]